MKKIYFLAVLLFPVSNSFAQTVDFETISLATETYDYGADGNGDFVFDDLTFDNYYDTQYDYHLGFAISNMTDVTTSGYLNQFSAYTGSGFNSENYAIYYNSGSISTNNSNITSFKITNTTYAALSMKDGDSFGKQFGSIYGADNVTEDGTNGEDYFRVWVIGSSFDGQQKDSVEVYLADYRFADNTQDYILDEWLNVDVSNFGFGVTQLDFRFESSDSDPVYGPNTPQYFAIDDVEYVSTLSVAESLKDAVSVYPTLIENHLTIEGQNMEYSILDAFGKVHFEGRLDGKFEIDFHDYAAGTYYIQFQGQNEVTVTKVIKL